MINVVYTDAYILTLLCGQRSRQRQVNNTFNTKVRIIILYISTSKKYIILIIYWEKYYNLFNLKLILHVLRHDLFYRSLNYDVEYLFLLFIVCPTITVFLMCFTSTIHM